MIIINLRTMEMGVARQINNQNSCCQATSSYSNKLIKLLISLGPFRGVGMIIFNLRTMEVCCQTDKQLEQLLLGNQLYQQLTNRTIEFLGSILGGVGMIIINLRTMEMCVARQINNQNSCCQATSCISNKPIEPLNSLGPFQGGQISL